MIVKPNEMSFEDKKISMIIAGVPGIGKTTLALSSPKPLLIDLDKGVSRVEARYRKDTLVCDSYEEMLEDLTNADLSCYETIVIDTGGKLLEMLKPVVISEDTKNAKRDGNLSLQGYGAVKRKFKEFVNFMKKLNKNLIIVFHATEVQLENDLTGLRIRIEGSSRDDVWDDIDVGGFLEMTGKKRTICFSNCERFYAKGTHSVHGTFEIPNLNDTTKNDFVSVIFEKIKNDLKQEVEEYNKYCEVMKFSEKIEKAKAKDLNKLLVELKEMEHCLTSKEELWFALTNKAKELGEKYDAKTMQFSNNTVTA